MKTRLEQARLLKEKEGRALHWEHSGNTAYTRDQGNDFEDEFITEIMESGMDFETAMGGELYGI